MKKRPRSTKVVQPLRKRQVVGSTPAVGSKSKQRTATAAKVAPSRVQKKAADSSVAPVARPELQPPGAEVAGRQIDQSKAAGLQIYDKIYRTMGFPKKYCPHIPTPKQATFLMLDCLEAFYGGAAGGGKSDALLMAALQYVHVPGYAAIIFRRTYKDLNQPEAIMQRSHEWLRKTDAHWNGEAHRWEFETGGAMATVGFGHLDNDKDLYDYTGAAFQYIAFDEETQFPEHHFTFMFSRLRRLKTMTVARVPLRMRGASNPGSEGHEWVKRRYIEKADGDQERQFIPAKMEDNPYLDPDYEDSLRRSSPLLYQRLRNGDWDATDEGTLFPESAWKQVDVCPADIINRKRFWDLAATEVDPKKKNDPDFTAGVRMSRGRDNMIYVEHCDAFRLESNDTRKRVRARAALDMAECGVVEQWFEEEGGSSGKDTAWSYVTEVLAGFDVHRWRVTGNKDLYFGPFAAQVQAGNVAIVRGDWNYEFIRWLAVLGTPAGVHDDHADAASKCYNRLVQGSGMYEVMRRRNDEFEAAKAAAIAPQNAGITAVVTTNHPEMQEMPGEFANNDERVAAYFRREDEAERARKSGTFGGGSQGNPNSGWSRLAQQQQRRS